MEEKLLEMEYVINGEKYLITATKVSDNEEGVNPIVANEIMDEVTSMDDEDDTLECEDVMIINCDDIPDCLTISDWLGIIEKYNIMILK